MMKGDKSLRVVGVQHVATRNMFTVHVRILLADQKGNTFYFDADSVVWDLQKLLIQDCPELHKIIGEPV